MLTLLYNFRRCCADVMALSTERRFTRFLMLEAVPYSSPSILFTRATCAAPAHVVSPRAEAVGGLTSLRNGLELHLVFWRHDKRDHGGASPAGAFKRLDELRA